MEKEYIIQVIAATMGTFGFAMHFRARGWKNILAATINGMFSWIVYLVVFEATEDIFMANLFGAVFVAFYSEVMARALKAPVNVYLTPGIIPLIPGKGLYMTISNIINGNKELGLQFGRDMFIATLGIVTGIVVTSTIVAYMIDNNRKMRNMRKKLS